MSLPHNNPLPAVPAQEYSAEERRLLLRIAHAAVAAAVAGRRHELPDVPPHLREPRGAFTTLHREGSLRGCIGYVIAQHPLAETVAQTAAAAALEDPRFTAVTAGELEGLDIEISVMSPLFSIRPEEVVVGRHGLLISYGPSRGLLLPQVATEYGWDADTFLSQTCYKAGLPPDAWQRGAKIEAFTAEVFGDQEKGRAEARPDL
jgi:AmmeMemoRadiSam system protein A